MTADKPIVVTGLWPYGNTAKDLLDRLGLISMANETYQLYQTWSECRLELFCADTSIDPKYLDQYRAFCPDWELWIRNINAKNLRFRLICASAIDEKKITEAGFTVEKEALKNTHIETTVYPLWGKLLNEESLTGWYTQEIPQVFEYPVNNEWDQVAVKVENYVRQDGTVDMVRCCSLIEYDEKTSQAGGV